MRRFVLQSFTIVLCVVCSVLLSSYLLFAREQGSRDIVVTASVRPMRVIVVNKELTILRIISNTREDVRPVVVLDSVDGQELPYSDSIRKQYEELRPSINFSKPGIVYERDERPLQAFFKRINGYITKLLQSPF